MKSIENGKNVIEAFMKIFGKIPEADNSKLNEEHTIGIFYFIILLFCLFYYLLKLRLSEASPCSPFCFFFNLFAHFFCYLLRALQYLIKTKNFSKFFA